MATVVKDIGISGTYHLNNKHVDGGDYKFIEPQQPNNRETNIKFLLDAITKSKNWSNSFITNEMDKEKNKDAPPTKKQRIDKK